MPGRLLRLVAIATLAGTLSGLLGVGGGLVIVPLLVLWLGYGEHEATGTSLAAIALIALAAAVFHGLKGAVDIRSGLLLGLPAVAGVLIGTRVQQRLPPRAVSGLLALLLTAAAVALVL